MTAKDNTGKVYLASFDPTANNVFPYRDPKNVVEIGNGLENEDLWEKTNLYFDHSGNLWIDDRGWIAFFVESNMPIWNTVFRSPIFIKQCAGGRCFGKDPTRHMKVPTKNIGLLLILALLDLIPLGIHTPPLGAC